MKDIDRKLSHMIRGEIKSRGMKLGFIAAESGIDYKRLVYVLSGRGAMSATEFLSIGKTLNLSSQELSQISQACQ